MVESVRAADIFSSRQNGTVFRLATNPTQKPAVSTISAAASANLAGALHTCATWFSKHISAKHVSVERAEVTHQQPSLF